MFLNTTHLDPSVGDKIKERNSRPANGGGQIVQGSAGQQESEIRDGNVQSLAGAENSARRVEMALSEPAHFLLLAVLPGRDVEQQVSLPASQLVDEQLEEVDDRSVLIEVGVHVQVSQGTHGALVKSLRDEDHVLLHVVGEAVVAVVGELPREERHQQDRVEEPAHDTVEVIVYGESTVPALVPQDPDAHADETLDVAVDNPGRGAPDRVRDLRDVGQSSPRQPAGHEQIPNDIAHRDPCGRLEAVSRDGISNGLNVRKFRRRGFFPRDLVGLLRVSKIFSPRVDRIALRSYRLLGRGLCYSSRHDHRYGQNQSEIAVLGRKERKGKWKTVPGSSGEHLSKSFFLFFPMGGTGLARSYGVITGDPCASLGGTTSGSRPFQDSRELGEKLRPLDRKRASVMVAERGRRTQD